MANEGAYAVSPVEMPALSLSSMWYVDEGASYDIVVPATRTDLVLIRTLAGRGEIHFKDGAVVVLGPNTTYVFDLRKAARYRCAGERWTFYWFEFKSAVLPGIPFSTIMEIPVSTSEKKELENCFALVRKSNVPALLLASAHLIRLLYGNAHQWQARVPATQFHQEAIERVVGLMHRNLTGISLDEMAKAACLSERRFRQVFMEITGKPPKQFYDILRLETAANLLLRGRDSVEALAIRFGYSSTFHFSRAFKKHTGVSPMRFRKQSQRQSSR